MNRLKELLNDLPDEEEEIISAAQKDANAEYVEVLAYSIEEALEIAHKRLKVSIADLEYDILEQGSNGFLGIGKKPYKILVKRTVPHVSKEIAELEQLTKKAVKAIEDIDGTYKVRVTKDGIFVIINPPKGKGRKISEQEVLNAIFQKDIKEFDKAAVSKAVKDASGEPVKIGEYIPNPQYDGRFSIEVSDDELKAYITLYPPLKSGRVVEFQEILEELENKGVVFGIKEEVIKDAVDNDKFNQPILIAEGIPAKDGDDGKIEYKVKVEKEVKLAENESGKVDFRELDLIENVVVGQVLAKKIPAQLAQIGKTVTGRDIPAKDGKDVQFSPGKNVKLNDDGTELIAEINGQVVFAKGQLSVEPVYEVKGDVSLQTGNIVFLGTVVVRGNVEDGFSVKAAGNINISGNVGKAQLEAEGDIVIKQGLLGKDEAEIIAGNDLFAKFIEHAKKVEAGRDVIAAEAIMHSNIDAGKRVICNGRRAMIVGGRVRAGEEINAKVIGSPSYTETDVEVGVDPKSRQQLVELNEELRESKDKVRELSMNITTLENQKRSAHGKLPPEKNELLINMVQEREELNVRMTEIEEQIEEIKSYLASIEKVGKISVQKEVYPKVKITVKDAFLEVKDSFKFVTFTQEAGNIKILPYEESKVEKKSQRNK